MVRVTAVRRSFLRDGQCWLGATMGSLLGTASLLINMRLSSQKRKFCCEDSDGGLGG